MFNRNNTLGPDSRSHNSVATSVGNRSITSMWRERFVWYNFGKNIFAFIFFSTHLIFNTSLYCVLVFFVIVSYCLQCFISTNEVRESRSIIKSCITTINVAKEWRLMWSLNHKNVLSKRGIILLWNEMNQYWFLEYPKISEIHDWYRSQYANF